MAGKESTEMSKISTLPTPVMEPWQNTKTELWQQNDYLLSTGQYSDCTFVVGLTKPNSTMFQCHKLFLAKCSSVFEAMLYGPALSEKNVIEVTDVKSEVFHVMLQFIYTGRVEMEDLRMILDLCMVADKYMIIALRETCVKKLTDDLSPHNVFQIHAVAKTLNLTALEEHAFEVMIERTNEVLETKEFLDASKDQVLLLVQQETLNYESEGQLIEACLKWAKCEAKRQQINADTVELRKVLGPIFEHLRFLALDYKMFTSVTGKSNVLTDAEKCKLIFNIIEQDFGNIPNDVSIIRTPRSFYSSRRNSYMNVRFKSERFHKHSKKEHSTYPTL